MSGIRMQKQGFLFLFMALLLLLPLGIRAKAETFDRNHYIYDYAEVLTDQEVAELQALSSKLGEERDTAFIIITVNGTDGKEIKQYVEDFYDEHAPGYDQPHGNTAILTIDMQERDVYLAGFKKAEQYLDDGRLNSIRDHITPDLSAGNYFQAFSAFLNTTHEYMGYEPGNGPEESKGYDPGGGTGGYTGYDPGDGPGEYSGNEPSVNPENILFKWWFQLIAAITVAGVIVTIIAFRSGGRVTVNAQTYIDSNQSKVISQYDNFVRQTVTKQRKPSNNNTHSGGGGSGGGITSGGHSHSGSSGKF
ncbi:TPM domain-containing protein [Neobacillus sp.]|uniref:TPM domain-containing protein n=1 Tax=Neobacillus sp. TaxID=2675273 RepID=UPI00289CE1C9|nr:TPM domain-containing protein [Neobacillus sp.]